MHAQGGDAPDERDPNVLFSQREWWAARALNLEVELSRTRDLLRSARRRSAAIRVLVQDHVRRRGEVARRPYRPSMARS